MKSNRVLNVIRVALMASAVVGYSAPALAHGGNNDPNMVHACVGKGSQIARIVGVTGSCLPSETPAHWPEVAGTGPQGPKGDKGDPGVDGTNGTNGAPGTNGTNGTNGAGLTSYEQLAGLPCTTAANAAATVQLVGLLKRPICAAAISANERFVDLGTAIFDTRNNLLWEKKDTAGGLHDVANRYTWCAATGIDTNPAIGFDICAGTGPSWISQVNAAAFGGFNDWRVPTREELLTIRNANCQPDVPCTDPIFGPALYVGFQSNIFGTLGGPYWASNLEGGLFGFIVDFFGGSAVPMSFAPEFPTLEFPIRAVRTAQ